MPPYKKKASKNQNGDDEKLSPKKRRQDDESSELSVTNPKYAPKKNAANRKRKAALKAIIEVRKSQLKNSDESASDHPSLYN